MDGGGNYTGEQPVQKLTAEAAWQFYSGIELTLSRWPSLRMAVENRWGGPHSHLRPQQILIDLYNLFTQSKERVYTDDVEDLLDDAMLSLNLELNDGSVQEIAAKLMLMYEDCLEDNFSSIEMLRATSNQNVVVPNVAQVVDDSDNDSEDMVDDGIVTPNDSSDMAIDVALPQSTSDRNKNDTWVEPHVEGWSVVSSKRNKGRKK